MGRSDTLKHGGRCTLGSRAIAFTAVGYYDWATAGYTEVYDIFEAGSAAFDRVVDTLLDGGRTWGCY
jgi:hypothetical protein